ncbi:MAG: electron transfer flavoprotein subunit beta, partial [Thermoplasmata archaeon]
MIYLNILVLVKQVPDTSDVKFDERGVMIREGVQSILNVFDQFALEEALRLRQKYGGEVSVMTLAPEQ